MNRRRHSNAGTLMVELLGALVLLAVLSAILGELFVMTLSSIRDSERRDNLFHHVDSAVESLRRDVWQARIIGLDGQRVADITLSSGDTAVWRFSSDGTLTRTLSPRGQAEIIQSWAGLPAVAFSSTGPLVTLTLQASGNRDESITFISEQILAGGKR